MSEARDRTVAIRRKVESRALEQLTVLGWESLPARFTAFACEQQVNRRLRNAIQYVYVALALLDFPPELGAALASQLHTLRPLLRYNPFGLTMLAMSQLDSLRKLTAEQRQCAGEVLALVLLAYLPSTDWARLVYASTPFDERIRSELDRALRAYAPELAERIITPPIPRPSVELSWLRYLDPTIALTFVAEYLFSMLTPPLVNAGLGATLGKMRTGDWTRGWFWGLTAGIAIAVVLQQFLYRPRLRHIAAHKP